MARIAKSTLALLLTAVVLVIALQNTESMTTRLVFWSVSAPRSIILFMTFLVGLVSGAIAGYLGRPQKAQ